MTTLINDNFQKTNKKVRITFGGWDGKSYNGEAVNLSAFTNPAYPDMTFVRTRKVVRTHKGKALCFIYHEVTNESHPVSGEKMVRVFCFFDNNL